MFGLIKPPPASPPPADVAAARARFTCPKYAPAPGQVRCSHNVGSDGSACDLPTFPMCVEWLRLNGQGVEADRILGLVPAERPSVRPPPPPAAAPAVAWSAAAPPPPPEWIGRIPPAPGPNAPDPPPLPPLPGGDFAALFSDEALRELVGTEVDLEFPGIGVVTLLAEHTDQDRLELTWRDVRRLVAVAYVGFQGKAWLRGLRRRRPKTEGTSDEY